MEENLVIKKVIKRVFFIILIFFSIAVVWGIIETKIFSVEYFPQWYSKEDIFRNNITQLFKNLKYSFLSLGGYSLVFIWQYGKIVGTAIIIIFDNYGIEILVKGFLSHAIAETVCCFISAVISPYIWYSILEVGIRNVHKNKKKYFFKSLILVIAMIVLMVVSCIIAAYLEENVSERNFLLYR